ncbi:MAG: ABC transporter permease [Bacteroidota bacterium]
MKALPNLSNTNTIFRKELRSYFNSAIAYVVIVVFFVLMGWFYASNIFLVNIATLRNMFEYAGIIFLFVIPAMTMRLLAEERKSGTIELLSTKPLHDVEIVLGKFLASWAFVGITVLPTLVYYFIIVFLGDIDHGPVFGGYLGLMLMTGVYVAVGLLASSLTENQIVAFMLGLFFCVVLFFIDKMLIVMPDFATGILQFLSVDYHFSNIARGVIDTRDVVYFLSVLGFSLYLSVVSLERRKW